MKIKLLAFLTVINTVSLNEFALISCHAQQDNKIIQPNIEDNSEQKIHQQIKTALKEPLEFNEDWIIDYQQDAKNIAQFVNLLVDKGWTYLSKTITFLVKQRLEEKIDDLFTKYPDFTLSTSIVPDDTQLIVDKLIGKEQVDFHYDLYYNLQAIQDIDFNYLNNYQENRGKLVLFNGEFAQYSLLNKYGNKNRIKFRQKDYIADDQVRLDYLAKMVNTTPTIKIYDQYYRTFAFMTPRYDYIASVIFNLNDFKDTKLVKLIHDDQSYFLQVKDLIIKNLKANLIGNRFVNIKDLFENAVGIIDDIEIDIELDKAYLTSEIEVDENLNNIYGSDVVAFDHDMLLLKLKTTLKRNGVSSSTTIDETIALDIDYE